MIKRLSLVLLLLPVVLSESAAAQEGGAVRIGDKHLMILRSGLDAVWGSYIFAIRNESGEEQEFSTKIMLPKETVDFHPQEGISPEDVILPEGQSAGGGVQIQAKFAPGMTLVSMGFKVPGRFGEATLTLEPDRLIEDFTVLKPAGTGLEILAPGLDALGGGGPDNDYEGYLAKEPLAPGKPLALTVTGLPEGRMRWWIMGGVFAALLFVSAFVVAWRTRPRGGEDTLVLTD